MWKQINYCAGQILVTIHQRIDNNSLGIVQLFLRYHLTHLWVNALAQCDKALIFKLLY